MAGSVEERTCTWCRWHDWDTDRCILNGKTITGTDEACNNHATTEEYRKYLEELRGENG